MVVVATRVDVLLRSASNMEWYRDRQAPPSAPDWVEHKSVVYGMWGVLCAVMFHFLWTDRNRFLIDGRQPTPAISALAMIFINVSAHVRYCRRRVHTDDDETVSPNAVLNQMKIARNMVSLMKAHGTPFVVRHKRVV